MDVLTAVDLRELTSQSGICVSICMPAHRAGAEALQDPVRLKNLLRAARSQLHGLGLDTAMVRQILAPAVTLVDDHYFWQLQHDGLAIYCAPGFFRFFRTPQWLPELVVVASRFHLNPMLPLLAADTHFNVLAVSQTRARLFLASREQISELELPASPAEEKKERLIEHFRVIDQSVHDILSKAAGPLILAGADYVLPIYRQASSYPQLLEDAVSGNVDDLTPRDLLNKALPIALAHFSKAEERAADQFHQLKHTGLASSDLPTVLRAASDGRVQSLFVAVEVQIWGVYRPEERELAIMAGPAPEAEDLLNLAAMYTFMNNGEVHAVQPDRVPGGGPLAATFRY